jgi:hypothetical protein
VQVSESSGTDRLHGADDVNVTFICRSGRAIRYIVASWGLSSGDAVLAAATAGGRADGGWVVNRDIPQSALISLG